MSLDLGRYVTPIGTSRCSGFDSDCPILVGSSLCGKMSFPSGACPTDDCWSLYLRVRSWRWFSWRHDTYNLEEKIRHTLSRTEHQPMSGAISTEVFKWWLNNCCLTRTRQNAPENIVRDLSQWHQYLIRAEPRQRSLLCPSRSINNTFDLAAQARGTLLPIGAHVHVTMKPRRRQRSFTSRYRASSDPRWLKEKTHVWHLPCAGRRLRGNPSAHIR